MAPSYRRQHTRPQCTLEEAALIRYRRKIQPQTASTTSGIRIISA
jgi:hypothetical protein